MGAMSFTTSKVPRILSTFKRGRKAAAERLETLNIIKIKNVEGMFNLLYRLVICQSQGLPRFLSKLQPNIFSFFCFRLPSTDADPPTPGPAVDHERYYSMRMTQ